MSDNNLEPLSSSSNKETGSLDPDKDKQSDTLNTEEDTPAPIPVQVQSSHELESIIIFDLCECKSQISWWILNKFEAEVNKGV